MDGPIPRPTPAALCAALLLLTACSGEGPVRTWEQTVQGAYAAAFSEDAGYSLVGSLNHGVSLWRVGDANRLFDWNHQAGEYTELVAAAFAPDNRFAVTADPRTLVRWDVASGESTSYWTTPANVRALAMAGDGRHVLMGLEDHSALFFNAERGNLVHTFLHEGPVRAVAINPQSTHALTGSEDFSVRLWALAEGTEARRWDLAGPVGVVALSPDASKVLAASRGDRVVVFDAASDAPLYTLYAKNPGITVARFSRDGSLLLTGNVNRMVDLWDIRTGQRLKRWNTEARNPWRPSGTAILALAFGDPGAYYAITGDGLGVELR